jgi:phenylpropionate dioxygenase-like ring-hydroxylating dioxygenase large terminal subunit
MSRFPFPSFPNGWFQFAYSDELAPGQVKPLEYFGKQLVAYRGQDGAPHVLDAFCPHLGAHLGHGGKVEGDTIRCPFHAWRFDGEGRCVEVPYASRIPQAARLACWPVIERNGLLMVWHHAEGKLPDFDIPTLAEVGHEDWTPHLRLSWKLRTHNQEMAENAVDRAHFRYVHGTLNVPESEVKADGPVLRMVSKAMMATPKGDVPGQIASESYGFGFGVVRFSGIVETLLVTSVTPIEGEHVDVRFGFSVKKVGNADITRGVGRALIADIEKQMNEDRPIWEHKVYQPRPVLCDGDGPIGVFRRWCQQFYTFPAGATPATGAAA